MSKKLLWGVIFLTVWFAPVYPIQPDTLIINQANSLPTIDGEANDSVWIAQKWIDIDQMWIPFDKEISSSDFSGRFKVLWSPSTQLLYFVAEITDDVFRDGYIYSKKNVTYGDYDIFEVFIDPDRSGGLHVFDGKCADAGSSKCWGTNAENAFTYHINANAPPEGQFTTLKSVEDISGNAWRNLYIRNYAEHLPQFAFLKTGQIYTYEFSLKVYKDTYNPKLASELDRDILFAGKMMGLSVAYCDSDVKTGKPKRDSFIGSTKADPNALDNKNGFNQAWMNASYLGLVILTK